MLKLRSNRLDNYPIVCKFILVDFFNLITPTIYYHNNKKCRTIDLLAIKYSRYTLNTLIAKWPVGHFRRHV